MIILGAQPTMQFVDGNGVLPVFRHLADTNARVALTAPGLTYAADVIATQPEPDRTTLTNSLDDILRQCRPPEGPGLDAPVAACKFLPFGLDEIEAFPPIARALAGAGLARGTLEIQILAIARTVDLPLALLDGPRDRDMLAALGAAGFHLQAVWIG
ncbi:hypothetical protein [Rhodovulum sp.]|uniref:hypothetical protein n=1 Tax=Rhodovulum sp. TaxID=34009 RepID=UPI001793FE10|nr:hypothetical protein [Rhodovulum sp.]HDR29320.1 hypothetical protein [Rhodovulum sp.]